MANLVTITLVGSPGGFFVTDPRLAYATVVTIKRAGQRYYPVNLAAQVNSLMGLVCYHNSPGGTIVFARTNRFDTTNPETVHVVINQI